MVKSVKRHRLARTTGNTLTYAIFVAVFILVVFPDGVDVLHVIQAAMGDLCRPVRLADQSSTR